ncbi:MAG: hypothetical protein JWM74_5705 [Myxococcaceae bacterium]|nr:hypothetical protein [Myxococcaceae bacterium]
MIPVTFEEAAGRSQARRVVDAEIAFIRERCREPLAGVVEFTEGGRDWDRALVTLAALFHSRHFEGAERITFEAAQRTHADDGPWWWVKIYSPRGEYSDGRLAADIFAAWGLP